MTSHQEIQIKILMRCHSTPGRMAITKNTGTQECWRGSHEGFSHTTSRPIISSDITENSMEAPQKLKIKLPHDPAIHQ